MSKYIYNQFNNFILRTPLLPIVKKSDINSVLSFDYFREALFLASPEFSMELNKDNNIDTKSKSIYKYFSRSFSRCTPFGLFAGCSVGEFGDKTDIVLAPLDKQIQSTRLDMNYICALIQKIESDLEIKKKLTYFPNDSLYNVGDKKRYIEYYYKGVKRIHNITSIETNEYIETILNISKDGATIEDIANSITDDEITYDDAKEFVENLIDSQILKSELEPRATGDDTLNHLISQLANIKEKNYLPKLEKIKQLLDKIDNTIIGESLTIYEEIIKVVEEIGVVFEPKFLFQADLFKPAQSAVLDRTLSDKINTLISFLNSITPKSENENIRKFKEAFVDRFEEQEMPLEIVLDGEIGIGYPVNNNDRGDISTLVDDLALPMSVNNNSSIPFNDISKVLLDKYINAIRHGKDSVNIEDADFKLQPNTNFDELPDTMAMMGIIVHDNSGNEKIITKPIGGSSAANLMGRFCHIDNKIYDLVKSITKKEQELSRDAILVEIAHLPESRIGNIALRPKIREYELKYLAGSCVDREKQLTLSDIMVSVKNGRIVLKSNKLNKEIIPHLTNAHNFSFNSMPVYHFLCDMQIQNKKGGLWLDWSGVFDYVDYLPRLEYGDFILSLQKWRIDKEEIKDFEKLSDNELIERFRALKERHKITNETTIDEGDNALYIDFNNVLSLRTLLTVVKKHQKLVLSEFPLANYKSVIVDSEGNQFNNEFIIPFYKNK